MSGFVFLCVVVVAASFAQFGVDAFAIATGARPSVHANGTRSHCGLVDKWSAYMAVLGTVNSGTLNVLYTQMDYDRSLQAVLNYTSSNRLINKVVIDYNKDSMYFLPADYPDQCYKIPISLPLVRQIPDDAEYLGSSYLGPMGAGQLDYDGWRFSAVKGKTKAVFTLAVSKQGCVPLVEGAAYSGAPNEKQLYMFAGFQPKLTDPSAFDLPKSCFK